MNQRVHYILSLLLLLQFQLCWSQETTVSAVMDSSFLLIGDQTKLTLEVNKPASLGVTFPSFMDTITREIEVLEYSSIDSSILEDGQIQLRQTLTVTSFDTGYHVLPPFKFVVHRPGYPDDTMQTKKLGLEVLLVPVDTSQAIKPIKGPENIPLSWRDRLPWILGILIGLLVIGLALFLILRKKAAPEPNQIRRPKEPAHVIALRDLDKLKTAKVWQAGDIKGYHSQLTEIVRTYIEHRFQIQALEQTSDQVIRAFEYTGLSNSVPMEELKQMLYLADLVKFAKGKPLPSDNERSLDQAYSFVKQTLKRDSIVNENQA